MLNTRSSLRATTTMVAASAAPALAPGDAQVPQAPWRHATQPNDYVAPDACLHWRQLTPPEHKYRTTNNDQFVYTDAVFGVETWFDVKCGDLTFSIPLGTEALVDLTAVAELDCGHFDEVASKGWCGGRFLINGEPLPHPDNTGREDSYAWDSAAGGGYDYQAHALAQEYHAICQEAPTGAKECHYRVQLQSRLEAGARSVWIDDLTMRVDVTAGPVVIV